MLASLPGAQWPAVVARFNSLLEMRAYGIYDQLSVVKLDRFNSLLEMPSALSAFATSAATVRFNSLLEMPAPIGAGRFRL